MKVYGEVAYRRRYNAIMPTTTTSTATRHTEGITREFSLKINEFISFIRLRFLLSFARCLFVELWPHNVVAMPRLKSPDLYPRDSRSVLNTPLDNFKQRTKRNDNENRLSNNKDPYKWILCWFNLIFCVYSVSTTFFALSPGKMNLICFGKIFSFLILKRSKFIDNLYLCTLVCFAFLSIQLCFSFLVKWLYEIKLST